MLTQNMRLDFGSDVVLRENANLLQSSLNKVVEGMKEAQKKATELEGAFLQWEETDKKVRKTLKSLIGDHIDRVERQKAEQLQAVEKAKDRLASGREIVLLSSEEGKLIPMRLKTPRKKESA